MLSSISWQTYLHSVAFTLLIYYAFVAFTYYRYEISELINGRKAKMLGIPEVSHPAVVNMTNEKQNSMPDASPINAPSHEPLKQQSYTYGEIDREGFSVEPAEQARHSLFVNLALQLEDELKQLFQEARKKSYIKEELILALQKTLVGYTELTDSHFKPSVHNYIAVESENQCSIHLDAEELNRLWKK